MNVLLAKSTYAPGDEVTITATITQGGGAPGGEHTILNSTAGQPVTNANVTAQFTRPGMSTPDLPPIVFTNNGDGTYSGTYTNTQSSGTYDFKVLAEVPNPTIPDQPFIRQSEQSFYVINPFNSRAVVFGSNSVLIREQTTIVSGDIVVNNVKTTPGVAGNVELWIREQSATPAGYSIEAPRILINAQVKMKSDIYYNTLTSSTTIPAALKHTPLSLPVLAMLPVFQVAAPGQTDVTVAALTTTTLQPGSYRNMTINSGGKVLLAGGRYDFNNLVGGDQSRLVFSAGTEVRIATTCLIGAQAYIGPGSPAVDASGIVFYVGGTSSSSPVVQLGAHDSVFANFYAPKGPILLSEQSTATGAFFGTDVTVREQSRLALSSYFLKNAGAAFKKETAEPKQALAAEIPTAMVLNQNYPNPFNPTTQIRYGLPQPSHVTLTIYNLLGQEVARLADEEQEAGFHEIRWDGRSSSGTAVGSGVYIYRIQAGDIVQTKKMILLK
jgi:hypothetical protein